MWGLPGGGVGEVEEGLGEHTVMDGDLTWGGDHTMQ